MRTSVRRPRAIALLLGPAVLGVCLAVGIVPTAHAVTKAAYENAAITATNAERSKKKLATLKRNGCLERYADRWALASTGRQYLRHSDMGIILRACKLRGVSENIAYGYGSGAAVTKAWMNSPGHRTNIMRGSSRLIGMGAYQDRRGVWWVSEIMGHA